MNQGCIYIAIFYQNKAVYISQENIFEFKTYNPPYKEYRIIIKNTIIGYEQSKQDVFVCVSTSHTTGLIKIRPYYTKIYEKIKASIIIV